MISLYLCSCDRYRKNECEWYIEPKVEHKDLVEPGWVPLCIKNYKIGRQKCFLSARLKWAERAFGKTFRYSDVKIEEDVLPRKIIEAKPCTAMKKN